MRGYPMVHRIHWFAYIRPVLLLGLKLVVALSIALVAIPARAGITEQLIATLGLNAGLSNSLVLGTYLLGLLAFVWSAARSVIYILELRQVRVGVSENCVEYWHGLFPWDQHYIRWYPDQVYNATFTWATKYVGWAFKYGAVIITSMEGTTRETRVRQLSRPDRLAGAIVDLARSSRS
jgi:hypothetical protein